MIRKFMFFGIIIIKIAHQNLMGYQFYRKEYYFLSSSKNSS